MLGTRTTVACSCFLALLGLAGCRISSEKHGDNSNVRVATPLGDVQVKTNDAANQASLGLPVYPGATRLKKEGSDNGAADIHMSFGNFQLRVNAASFHTPDTPDQVQAFYGKALHRFGDVITCRNHHAVGTPTKTAEGLACRSSHDSSDGSSEGDVGGHSLELKAGSEQHQHIVSIDPQDSGTKFGLVALDLPGQLSHEKGDRDEAEQ